MAAGSVWSRSPFMARICASILGKFTRAGERMANGNRGTHDGVAELTVVAAGLLQLTVSVSCAILSIPVSICRRLPRSAH